MTPNITKLVSPEWLDACLKSETFDGSIHIFSFSTNFNQVLIVSFFIEVLNWP